MKYDAVIFDLFGTLVETVSPDDYAEMLGEVSSILGAGHQRFTDHWRETIDPRESGELGGIDGILRTTAEGVGATPTDEQVAQARERWLSIAGGWLAPRDNTRHTLTEIKARGMQLGLLSNCSAEIPPLWPQGTLGDLFDVTVFSCEAGAMKPAPAVYEAVYGALGVAPERCMYVGDGGARELTGAAALGMHAVLLRAPGEEHTWFDAFYRQDALEWPGTIVSDLSDLLPLL